MMLPKVYKFWILLIYKYLLVVKMEARFFCLMHKAALPLQHKGRKILVSLSFFFF